MHAATINSPRLTRVLTLLRDGAWHSTRDIIDRACVCAVNSCISELRENGYAIDCKQIERGRYWYHLEMTQ